MAPDSDSKVDTTSGEENNDAVASETVPLEQYNMLVDKLESIEKRISEMDQGILPRYLGKDENKFDQEEVNDLQYFLDYMRSRAALRLQQREEIGPIPVEAVPLKNDPSATTEKEDGILATQLILNGSKVKPSYLSWVEFKKFQRDGRKQLLEPIHVLIGEPELDPVTNFNVKKEKKQVAIGHQTPVVVGNMKDSARSGRKPLPERIRITPESLLTSLNQYFDTYMPVMLSGVIFLRPFKSLVCYEPKLREHSSTLRERIVARVQEERRLDSPTETLTDQGSSSESAADKVRSEALGPNESIGVTDTDGSNDELHLESIRLLHLECLLDFFDTDIRPKLDYIAGDECQKILFDDLWHLFKPGTVVLEQGEKQAYRLIRVVTPTHMAIPTWARWLRKSEEESSEQPLKLECVYIDFDGKQFGPVSKTFKISRYEEEKPIKSLPVYPLRFSADQGIRDRLIDRSKMLLHVATYKPMYYMGFTLDTREEVDSQVVVDFNEALSVHQDWKPEISLVSTESKEEEELQCEATCCAAESVHSDSYVDKRLTEAFVQSLLPQRASEQPSLIIYPRSWQEMVNAAYKPTEDERIIMTYRVFGFVLRSRKWAQLDLTHLRYENEQNRDNIKTAFDQLVLPPGHKDMVEALVTQHFQDREAAQRGNGQTDLVRGKGKGLIVLLHGAPGVGKTTTAEGVAEHFEKPLFQITCGDLGTTPTDVQVELEKNFSLASKWGCILLLDEADVFLAQRERKDLVRNALVAIFLRILEYYTGILFLTTNRVGDFDEAFASRIHISLHYPALDEQKTVKVFELNLGLIKDRFKRQGQEFNVDDDAVFEFAKLHYNEHKQGRWNGRQIRNACQTALALAQYDSRKDNQPVFLKQKHFKKVQTAYLDFSMYLGEIYGITGSERAKENHIRAGDNYGHNEPGKLASRAEKASRSFNTEQHSSRPTTSSINTPNQMTGQLAQQYTSPPNMGPSINTGYQGVPVQQYGQHMYNQPTGIPSSQMPPDIQGQTMQQLQQGWPGGPLTAQPQTQYSHPQQQQQYSQQLGFNPQSSQQNSEPTVGGGTNTGGMTSR
ncbi:hypothetical protein GL218_07412 [Daldinia childiae]|uniref:uncharacterized protein n=1 Tax=Daldinia childiae TaxID=326645 RepID=UPI001445C2AF|nr:uncharacterized protein GL218_07412 [Daldinia childiae]KAF3054783.1 hypothetical protein GL218_07412 [Daldinia childiae]